MPALNQTSTAYVNTSAKPPSNMNRRSVLPRSLIKKPESTVTIDENDTTTPVTVSHELHSVLRRPQIPETALVGDPHNISITPTINSDMPKAETDLRKSDDQSMQKRL